MIKKAVLPAAGLGTRFLPASKATPKEMLPIIDKPLIQYAVEEAVNIGINEIIFITSSKKYSIKKHLLSFLDCLTVVLSKYFERFLEINAPRIRFQRNGNFLLARCSTSFEKREGSSCGFG